ncbi:hypothetical protein [Algoriphagus confluentis]|uniref:DUF4386 domain-containing protein n=1 Tax=Algoriphagus confluentis TaxID=1697556 RepID=A0ABQ6PPM4_9BACT|nr:hypothetical protein Aconfl_22690 [Algoriphagus confluentis]
MNSLIQTCSQTRYLIVFGALVICFNVLLARYMPEEHALDLQFAYSPTQAYDSLAQMEESERNQYSWAVTVFDMPYLLAYGLFFSGILYRLSRKNQSWLIPFAVAFFDLLENISILLLLRAFPEKSTWVALLASFSSTSKWIFVLILFSMIGLGLFNRLFKRQKPMGKAIKAKI